MSCGIGEGIDVCGLSRRISNDSSVFPKDRTPDFSKVAARFPRMNQFGCGELSITTDHCIQVGVSLQTIAPQQRCMGASHHGFDIRVHLFSGVHNLICIWHAIRCAINADSARFELSNILLDIENVLFLGRHIDDFDSISVVFKRCCHIRQSNRRRNQSEKALIYLSFTRGMNQ